MVVRKSEFGGVVPTAPKEGAPSGSGKRRSVLRATTEPPPDRGQLVRAGTRNLHRGARHATSSQDVLGALVDAPGDSLEAGGIDTGRGNVFRKVFLAKQWVHNFKKNKQKFDGGVYVGSRDEQLMVEQELLKLPMLANCSPSFVEELARSTKFRRLPAGPLPDEEAEVLSMKFVLVLRGRILVFIRDWPVAHLSPGKHYGEAVLLGLETKPHSGLSAEVSSTIAEISREQFRQVLKEFDSERRWFNNISSRTSPCGSLVGSISQPCQLFSGLAQEVMRDMDTFMLRRLYFPGEHVVEEGQDCDELLTLVWGKVGVEMAGRFVRYESSGLASEDGEPAHPPSSSPPRSPQSFRPRRLSRSLPGTTTGVIDAQSLSPMPCFGELGLLGLQPKHCASMVAMTVCHFRVLHRSLYQHVLREHSVECPGEDLSSLSLPRSPLTDIATFREADCHPEFLDFLESHLEMRVYPPKQHIHEEADLGQGREQQERCVYMIAHGTAMAMKGSKEVGRLTTGDAFGCILGIPLPAWVTASIFAQETCYVRILHQGVIMRGLELFPEDRKNLLLRAQPRRLSVNGSASSLAPMPQHISIVGAEEGTSEVKPNADAIAAAELAMLRDPGMRGAIMHVLRGSSFFQDVSEEFVEEIASTSVDRIYMPGDRIIEEGQRGDSMFVMISGSAAIYVADPDIIGDGAAKSQAMVESGVAAKTRVATLMPGGISGELAMLGVSPYRGATIQAETICSLWEISQDDGITFLERFPESRYHFRDVIVRHLERTVMARIIHLPLMQSFSRKFLTLMGLYCEREAYFPGDVIVREGQPGNKMYVINIGTARLFLKGVTVKTYGAGAVYAASVMLGIYKTYFGSLVALQTCHVIRMPRSSYWHAMEQYPCKRAGMKLRKQEEFLEEEFRGAMTRVAARKLVWNRHQSAIRCKVGHLTKDELLAKTMTSWKRYLRQLRLFRIRQQSDLARSTQVIKEYVEKKKEQLERAQELALAREECSSPVRCRGDAGGRGGVGDSPACGSGGRTAAGEELAKIAKEWTTPKPSPFYQLRVHNVFAKVMQRPAIAGPLLPLLQAAGDRRSPTSVPEERGAEAPSSPLPSPRPAGGREPREKTVRLPDI